MFKSPDNSIDDIRKSKSHYIKMQILFGGVYNGEKECRLNLGVYIEQRIQIQESYACKSE